MISVGDENAFNCFQCSSKSLKMNGMNFFKTGMNSSSDLRCQVSRIDKTLSRLSFHH